MRAIAGGVVSLLLVSIIIVVSIVLLADNGKKKQQQSSTEAQELGSSRIIGGREANANRYPYTVTLLNRINAHACGGTLIARDVVLTAAHCQGGTGTFIGGNIVVGRHNLNNDDEGTVYSNRTRFLIQAVIVGVIVCFGILVGIFVGCRDDGFNVGLAVVGFPDVGLVVGNFFVG
jgi:hypothetical protein